MKLEFKYFVSYSLVDKNGDFGLGNTDVTLRKPIKNMDDIKEVQEFIKKDSGFKTLAIINFIKIE